MKFSILLILAFQFCFAMADTPPPGTVKAKLQDGSGNPISSTSGALDVNISSSTGSSTVNQGAAGVQAWLFDLSKLFGAAPSSSNYLPARISNGTTYVDPTQIRALSSGTDSVNIGNFPATQPVSGTVTANAGTGTFTVGQATGTNLHTVVDSGAIAATISGTPNVAVTSSALPTGASTASNQTNGSAKTQIVDGSGNVVTSSLIAGPHQALDVNAVGISTATVGDLEASGTITTTCSTPTLACPAGSYVLLPINGVASLQLEIQGSFSGASLNVDGTENGTNWNTLLTGSGSSGVYSTAAFSATGKYRVFRISGLRQIRVRASALTSGSVSVDMNASIGSNLTEAVQLTADNFNANVLTTGHQSVTLARNDYSVTNVTTAAYTQLVASTPDTTNQLYIFDSSGQTLFLAVGAAGSEVNKAYIVPGGNGELNLNIPSGSRVSVKAVSGTASVGEISITFLK